MATIFPTSPTIGDQYGGYEWNGTAWIIIGIDLTQDYATQTELTAAQSAAETYADNAATTAAAGIVDAAPAALDTLNELAAALGDDANFATTVTNSIATKQDKSSAMVVVDNGADANFARPTGVGAVYWIGSVQPNNAAAYDMWWSG